MKREDRQELLKLKSQQQELLREIIARRGKQDLAFLIENILNDPDDSRYLKLAPFHHELIAELNTFWIWAHLLNITPLLLEDFFGLLQ